MDAQNITILHLFPSDSGKFIGGAKSFFDAPKIQNLYVFLQKASSEPHPNRNSIPPSDLCHYTSTLDFDLLILHSNHPDFHPTLEHFTQKKPIIISLWGADFFPLIKPTHAWLDRYTWKSFLRHRSPLLAHLPGIAKLASLVKFNLNSRRKHQLQRLQRATHLDPGGNQSLLHNSTLSNCCINNFQVIYYNIEFSPKVTQPSNKVQLGNSASMTNNHLDAALWISRSNAMDAEILVPCSYGDQMNAKHIQNNWPRRLRARTTFLKDFLPIEEWNELASNYSIKVFNHVRQEALGNILQAIANGQTVFINPRAISREFLDNIPVHYKLIYSDELTPLTEQQAQENRQALELFLGKRKVSLYSELNEIIDSFKKEAIASTAKA